MGLKLIGQILLLGTRLVGRSLKSALKQQQQSPPLAKRSISLCSSRGMSLEEAKQILNVNSQSTFEEAFSKFQRIFSLNDPKRGGSFYLQSKAVRAIERLDEEVVMGGKSKRSVNKVEKAQ